MPSNIRSSFGGDRGAQQGTRVGAIYGEWQVSNNPGFFKGQFNNFQREMIAINRGRAAEFQDLVVDLMRQRTKRKASSTGRLIQVTADKRNTAFTGATGPASTFGWFVGMPNHLDNSVAKYWRTIEEGSLAVWKRPFIGELKTKGGKPIWGWFGDSAAASGSRSFAVGPYTAPGKGGSTGKFRPWYQENKSGQRTYPPEGSRKGLMIKHEIAPMDAYRDAWNQIGPRAMSDWTKAWKASFGRIPTNKDKFLNAPARGPRKR